MKRAFDFTVALVGLTLASPLLILVMIAIWLHDFDSPFYVAPRMARGGGTFRMVKFRSMVRNADKVGGISTAADDRRITAVGRLVRRYKIDELIQLWNVLKGEMSLVGPRPQVQPDANLYTNEEKQLLSIRPGITDPASIVFSDEGQILEGSPDPDLLYNQIIRPWKSRLSLLYLANRSFAVDLQLIVLTLVALISRVIALQTLQRILQAWGADSTLCRVALRQETLMPYPPPGASEVVAQRQ
jgi:lipopolysaccharide/colanic/teichoic acid biosynthesis glycosyltransferase